MGEKISGYMVKYALTTGIVVVHDAELVEGGRYVRAGAPYPHFLRFGKGFVLTREEAERVARQLATRRIVSLKKELKRLENLEQMPKWAREEK